MIGLSFNCTQAQHLNNTTTIFIKFYFRVADLNPNSIEKFNFKPNPIDSIKTPNKIVKFKFKLESPKISIN